MKTTWYAVLVKFVFQCFKHCWPHRKFLHAQSLSLHNKEEMRQKNKGLIFFPKLVADIPKTFL